MSRRVGVAVGLAVAATAVAAIAARRRSAVAPSGPPPPLVRFAELSAVPFTVVTDDAAELHCAAVGPSGGRLVVLSHCWLGTHDFWGSVASALVADGFRVVAYDQRGHGRSTSGDDPISIDRLGSDLVAVLERVGEAGAVLVGHSMGGMAVQAAVTGHPRILDDLAGIVLVSTAARPAVLPVPGAVAARLVGERASVRIARRSPVSTRRAFGPGATAEQMTAVHDAMVATPGATRADCLVAISRLDLRTPLGHLTVPTRVVVGSHDRLTPPARSRQLTDLIPGAQMSFLDGIGHMVPLEAPDAVVAAVRSIDPTTIPVGDVP